MDIAGPERPLRQDRLLRVALFLVWAFVVLFLASRHVFWRDEVRALTLALNGATLGDMLRGLQGEGHPILWYLLLRGGHAILPIREVLPLIAFLVAAGAIALLVLRSPFRPWVLAVFLFGAVALFEYSVMARNYGMSMLILFALADRYPKHRDRGVLLGLLLALLCNSNVHSIFLAAGFLLFWLVELISQEGLRWSPRYRVFALNAAIAALGALACFFTVYPTAQDAALIPHEGGITGWRVLEAIGTPGSSFHQLALPTFSQTAAGTALLALLLVGSIGGLVRSPGAFLSSLLLLPAFMLLFQLVYAGGYRHQALFLTYLVAMYWLTARDRGGSWHSPLWVKKIEEAGTAMFAALLGLQLITSVHLFAFEAEGVPGSRARDLGELLRQERLLDATIVADPDFMAEPLAYYAPNPVYLLRQQQFGKVVSFTTRARLHLDLQDVLDDARMLNAQSGKPVVILLAHRLDPEAPPARVTEGYVWTFETDPEQVRAFLAATRKLASFGPAVTGETYDVYLLGR